MFSKASFANETATIDRQGVLAAVLVAIAVAGLMLLWPIDREARLSQQIGSELSRQDAQRVQTLMRAF
ncbi:protein of unknown function [Candidatus Filomicrobium marinum]|uniref:Uncharacterized protein n=2 Tax=Filomicrobium TaxID=119044 RepID=A0A0D6JFA8_9HYPH|nr:MULTISPECIES: hypothetical protein [Filomicrobium]MCV0370152.1 hypothetical protein [Filomicrobium sp.]CFX25479.1 protein of unknown function [Candidatus Filomicrobium marinum]CPR19303.1 protein of unknown function [Candidatus Filomicrobium marinum]SDO09191.1 hypothetical protein SAMN04488061_0235 [Filomicrobium insigne]